MPDIFKKVRYVIIPANEQKNLVLFQFVNIDKLIENLHKQLKLLMDLKIAFDFKVRKTMPEIKQNRNMIEFDYPKYLKLKRIYEKAIADGKNGNDVIYFEFKEILVDYAKYLLEYLKPKFEKI